MKIAFVSAGLVQEILLSEFTALESLEGIYSQEFISKCQIVPDEVGLWFSFVDGEWRYVGPPKPPDPTPDPEQDITAFMRGFVEGMT